ncbi:MAG TPA: P-loop NTPase fold protein [Chthoniobacterales bacterium]
MNYVRLISDEPCIDLEQVPALKPLIEQIGNAIAFSETPLVVGVHGDWGSGKTSFLHYLQYWLTGTCPQNAGTTKLGKKEGHPHLAPIWFEAWRYQHESAPVVALLHEIRSQLSFRQKLFGGVTKLSEVAVRGALLSVEDVTKKIGFQASKIQSAGESWERENLAITLPSNQLRELLDKALGDLLGQSRDKETKGRIDRRLVIFIDDLDRCEPETAYRLLEGIKIYLNLRRCVFVLGLNQREVERALAKVIPSESGADLRNEARIRAQEYLEKICANVWHLPLLANGDQIRLLKSWLTPALLPEDVLDTLIELIKDFDFLPPNIRRLKAFANNLARFFQRLNNPERDASVTIDILAIASYLQQFHPRIWRLIECEPSFYQELRAYVRGTLNKRPTPKDRLPEDSDLHPALAELVLPYVRGSLLPAAGETSRSSTPLSSFADRSYGHVLHAQWLIADTTIPVTLLRKCIGC